MTNQIPSVRDIARRAIAEKAILDAATPLHKATREQLAQGMEPGDKMKIKGHDGADLGQVWLTDPKSTHFVADEAALLEWVQANHPDEVITETVTITRVQPGWVKAMLAAGGVDEATGEVPPGVEEKRGTPTLTVKPSDWARALAAESVLNLGEVEA